MSQGKFFLIVPNDGALQLYKQEYLATGRILFLHIQDICFVPLI